MTQKSWIRSLLAKAITGPRRRPSLRKQVRNRRTTLPRLEQLEDRTVPTIVFDPQYGAEPVIPQEIAGGLNSPPVFFEFWGSYWQNGNGPQQLQQILSSAQKLLPSSYWSGQSQYGTDGLTSFGNAVIDTNDPPQGFSSDNIANTLQEAIDGSSSIVGAIDPSNVYFPESDSPSHQALYVVVTPPNITSSNGTSVIGYNSLTTDIDGISDLDDEVYAWVGGDPGANGGAFNLDSYTYTLSHEISEAITNPQTAENITDVDFRGVRVNPGASFPNPPPNSNQISDYEAQNHTYRLGGPGGVLVQSYWSAQNTTSTGQQGAFIIPDGNSQNFYVDTAPTDPTIPNSSLIIEGDQLANQNDTATLDTYTLANGTSGVKVTLNGETVQFDPGQINGIVVNLGSGNNTINVLNTLSNVPIFIRGSGTDTVNLGSSGSVQGIQGAVNIEDPGVGNFDTINVDDSADSTARTTTLSTLGANPKDSETNGDSWGQISGLAPGVINYEYQDTSSVTIRTGNVNGNVVNIQNTGTTTNLIGNADTTVNVGSGGSTQGIGSDVNLENAPSYNTINVDDSADSTARTVTVRTLGSNPADFQGNSDSWGQISGLASGNINYEYRDTASVSMLTTHTVIGTVVNVQGTGTTTNLIGNALTTVNVGSGGSVQGIQGTVNIENPPALNIINVDDSADSTARTVTLSTLGTNPADSEGNGHPWGQILGLAPAQINYEYYDTESLTVQTGNVSGNVVNVHATGSVTNLVGHARATINVGDGGSVQLRRDLNIENPPSLNIINVDDSADSTARTVTLRTLGANPADSEGNGHPWGQISGFASANINYEYNDTTSLTVQTNLGATVNVLATDITTTLVGNGPTTVNVGSGGSVQGIQGALNVENPPSLTSINVDDSADGTARTVTFSTLGANPVDSEGNGDSWGQISGLAPANINYEYADTQSLTVHGGSGGNTFYLQATGALPGGTTLDGGAGGDTFSVGSAASTLDPLQGVLWIYGQGSNGTMNIHDDATSSRQYYGIAASQFTRRPAPPSGPLGSPTQTINYFNLKQVNVYGGSGADLWDATSTASGTTTALYSGSGVAHNSNEIFVESTTDVIDDIHGPVAIHGTLYDLGEAYDGLNAVGHTYTLTTGMLQRDGIANITYDGIGEFFVATANNPYFGHTPNTVYVQSLGHLLAGVAVGAGDTVTVGQNGSMASILGDVGIEAVAGQVPKQIILDDSADTTSRTVTLGSDPTFVYVVNGLANGSQGLGQIGLNVDPRTPVSIRTGPGNDVIKVHDLTNAPALALDAGGGTNTLDYSAYKGTVQAILPLGLATGFAGGIQHIQNVTGSQGNDLLVGDANPNVLIGGTGRNVIIGGGGGDTLDASGASSDNILIGGTTDYDSNLAALDAIFAEWTRTDLGFKDRFSDLTTGTNGQGAIPLNQVNGTLILLTSTTVHADTSPDTLIGSNQTDPVTGQRVHNWFFYDFDDTLVNFLNSSDHKTKVK